MAPKVQKMKAKTATELIDEAASDPAMTAKTAVLNLGRLALHLGVHDPEKLQTIGTALGNIAVGIGKVAAAEAAQGGNEDDDAMSRFLTEPS